MCRFSFAENMIGYLNYSTIRIKLQIFNHFVTSNLLSLNKDKNVKYIINIPVDFKNTSISDRGLRNSVNICHFDVNSRFHPVTLL